MSDLKQWDNGQKKFDVTEASRSVNPWLINYGRDRYTYNPEMPYTSAIQYKKYEASRSHGYPLTAWL